MQENSQETVQQNTQQNISSDPNTSVSQKSYDPFETFEKNRNEFQEVEMPITEESKNKKDLSKKENNKLDDKKLDNKKIEDKNKVILEEEKPDLVLLRSQLDKERKNTLEAQKWGTKNSQKVKSVEKHLKSMLEEGNFSSDEEEQIDRALSILNSTVDEPDLDMSFISSRPFYPLQKYWDIANNELENFRKYTNDSNLNLKIDAFNAFVKSASPEEIRDIILTLESIQGEIPQLKKMLSIGEQYYNEGFKEVLDNGGERQLIKNKNKEIEKLSKEIEKLNKKLTEYEDYDKNPVYGIKDIGGSNMDAPVEPTGDAFEIFEHNRQIELKQRTKR